MTDDLVARARRGTRMLRAGAVLVVACAATVVAALVMGSPDISARGGPVTPAASDTARALTPPAAGAGGTAAPAGIGEVRLPVDLTWRDVAGVAVPQSTVAGPRDISAGLARGFSHDPAGAVFAAANIVLRINPQTGPGVFSPTLREQVVGPDKSALTERVELAYERLRSQAGVAYGQPVGQIYATLRGFRIEQYSEFEAWLRLLSEGPDGQGGTGLASMLLQLRWAGNDWALVAPAGGTFDASASLVTSAASYTPFVAGAP